MTLEQFEALQKYIRAEASRAASAPVGRWGLGDALHLEEATDKARALLIDSAETPTDETAE